jgi:nitroimidazol reductase NimA-like FMN-containing flavoprotein (pyridoxamine 5'-phosphate oxidase superfamily)
MMDPATLDRFFRDRRVAVLAIPRDDRRPPLTSPIWYDWDGTVFRIQIENTSAKAKRIAKLGRAPVSLTIQSEVPPYRYAVVYGTATLGPSTDAALRTRVARRYFGRYAGDQYVRQETAAGRGEDIIRVVTITPDRVVSHDFGPEAGWFGRTFFRVWRLLNPVPA